MDISYSNTGTLILAYGDRFTGLRKHFLKINKITQRGQITELNIGKGHRLVTIELSENEQVFSDLIAECKSTKKDFRIDDILGKTIILETEKIEDTINVISLKLDDNYFRDDFSKEYDDIKIYSARNIKAFLQGASKNVGISMDIINLLIPPNNEDWNDIYYLNKNLSKDYLQDYEDRSQMIDFCLAINESNIGEEKILNILRYWYESSGYLAEILATDPYKANASRYTENECNNYLKLRRHISANNSIIKNEKNLIDSPNLLDWDIISSSSLINWDSKFILKFIDNLNMDLLSLNPFLPWDETLIKEFEGHWNWANLSKNIGIVWNNKLMSLFRSRLDWIFYSANSYLPWNSDFIEKYLNKWDWKELSVNKGLPWSTNLIEKYLKFWDWDKISTNSSIFWDEGLLTKYKNEINWKILSNNNGSFWTREMIIKFSSKLDFKLLSQNTALPWTIELFRGIIDPTFFKRLRSDLFDEELLSEIDKVQKKPTSDPDDDEIDWKELAEKEKSDRDYYQNTPLDVQLGLRSETMDEIIEEYEREERQQAMEDLAYEEYVEEQEEKAKFDSLMDNPLLNNLIWNKTFGGIYSDSFLYDVLIEYEKSSIVADFETDLEA